MFKDYCKKLNGYKVGEKRINAFFIKRQANKLRNLYQLGINVTKIVIHLKNERRKMIYDLNK